MQLALVVGSIATIALVLSLGPGRDSSAAPLAAERGGGPVAPILGASLAELRTSSATSGPRSAVVETPVEFESAGVEPEAALTTGRRVLVRRASDGRPLPDALVTYLSWTEAGYDGPFSADEMMREAMYEADPEQALLDAGRSFRADERGELFLPLEPGLAMARSNELWTLEPLPGDGGAERTLRLDEDSTTIVHVRDESGHGIEGVDVAFAHLPWIDPDIWEYKQTEGPEGSVRFPHLGRRVWEATTGLYGDAGRTGSYWIVCELPFDELLSERLEPARSGRREIDFVLPATGSLLVQVRAPHLDSRELAGVSVDLYLERRLRDSDGAMGPVWDSSISSPCDASGVARFDHIGLRQLLTGSVDLGDGSWFAETHGWVGPTAPNEVRRVDVVLERSGPTVHGRVRTMDGGSVEGEALHVAAWSSRRGSRLGAYDCAIGAGGEFRVHLDEWFDGDRAPTVWQFETGGEVPLGGRLTSGWVAGVDQVDLGTVVLEPVPVLCSGRVVDPDGKPIPDARARFSCVGGDGDGIGSSSEWRASVRSDHEGRFQLVEECPTASVRVTASHDLHADSLPVVVSVGTRDVTLRLRPSGSVSGRVRGLSPDWRTAVAVAVTDEDGDWIRDVVLDAGGAGEDVPFRIDGLEPGTYSVGVYEYYSEAALTVVDDFVIHAGAVTSDARLEPLRIDPRTREIDVRVVDAFGVPAQWGEVYSAISGTVEDLEQDGTWSDLEGGGCTLLTAAPAIDVLVQVYDGGRLRVDGLTQSRRIQLPMRASGRLHLVPDLPDPPAGCEWSWWLVSDDDDQEAWLAEQFEHGGELWFRYQDASPGILRVELLLHHGSVMDITPSVVVAEASFEIVEGTAEQDFELDFGGLDLSERIPEALAELARLEADGREDR